MLITDKRTEKKQLLGLFLFDCGSLENGGRKKRSWVQTTAPTVEFLSKFKCEVTFEIYYELYDDGKLHKK